MIVPTFAVAWPESLQQRCCNVNPRRGGHELTDERAIHPGCRDGPWQWRSPVGDAGWDPRVGLTPSLLTYIPRHSWTRRRGGETGSRGMQRTSTRVRLQVDPLRQAALQPGLNRAEPPPTQPRR